MPPRPPPLHRHLGLRVPPWLLLTTLLLPRLVGVGILIARGVPGSCPGPGHGVQIRPAAVPSVFASPFVGASPCCHALAPWVESLDSTLPPYARLCHGARGRQ